MDSLPIHIDGFLLYVTPNKIYGNKTGQELIKKYRKKPFEGKSLKIKGNKVLIPCGKLDKPSIQSLKTIEDRIGLRILNKREPQALKQYQNISLQLPFSIE